MAVRPMGVWRLPSFTPPAMRHALLLTFLASLLSGAPLALIAQGSASPLRAGRTPSQRLAAIADEVLAHRRATNLQERLVAGLPIERLPDPTRAGAEAEGRWAAQRLARLARLGDAGLSEEEQLTRRVLLWELALEVERPRHHAVSFADVTPYASPLRRIGEAFERLPLGTATERAHYRRVQGDVPRYLLAVAGELRRRAAAGVRLAAPEIPAVLGVLRSVRVPAERSPFVPAPARLAGVADAEGQRFARDMRQAYEQRIVPALDALLGVFDSAYVARAPKAVGLGHYPGGAEAYRFLVKQHTTTALSPEAIHAIGVREVARIEGAMAEIRRGLGVTASAPAFLEQLRRDPRFLASTPDEVGARLMAYQQRLAPEIGRAFRTLPRAGSDARRLDPRLEGSQTFGYYDPPNAADSLGHYYFNGSQLADRPLLSAGALSYHELLPGHHLQVALQLENRALPPLRRVPSGTAYIEGWGDYASELAGELGMYRDPWEQYGRLQMEMFLACRLVVDTGMNALGWSRDSATAYLLARVIESPTQLATETLRYSTDIPAQALAYKMGAVELLRLRERARTELGARFDLRDFHDVVLGSGALPLSVLEWKVERWLARP
jgi:uncharacterized protein (DUF885 family)